LNLPGEDTHLIGHEDVFQLLIIFLLENEGVRNELVAGGPGAMKRLYGFYGIGFWTSPGVQRQTRIYTRIPGGFFTVTSWMSWASPINL